MIELSLAGNSIQSPLVDSPNDILQLKKLDLSNNHLSKVPLFGANTLLSNVMLTNNLISDIIPSYLFQIPNLITIDISNNKLNGSIPSLVGLQYLQTLNLENNKLSGPIPDLSSLVSLTSLNLRNNLLSGSIPKTIGSLVQVAYI